MRRPKLGRGGRRFTQLCVCPLLLWRPFKQGGLWGGRFHLPCQKKKTIKLKHTAAHTYINNTITKLVLLVVYTPYILQYTPNVIKYTICRASPLSDFFCRHTWRYTGHMRTYFVHSVLDVRACLLKLELRFRSQNSKSAGRYGLDVARVHTRIDVKGVVGLRN